MKGHQNGQSEKWAKWKKCQDKTYGSDVYFWDNWNRRNILFEKKWLKTGDIGYFNEKKDLILLGRKNNIIKNRGFQMCPEEIESYLKDKYHLNSLLIKKKELILIIEGDGNNIRKDRVLNDLKIKFSSYKIPDKIEIIKRFERTVTGKIKRKV